MKQFSIVRKRFAIIRDDKEILCGIVSGYQFRPFDKIRNAHLKTYDTKFRAQMGLRKFLAKHPDTEEHSYKITAVSEAVMELRDSV